METVVLPAQDHLAQERYRHQSSVMSAHVMAGLMYPHGGIPRTRKKVKSQQQVLVASSLHSDRAIASSDKTNLADAAKTGPFRLAESHLAAAIWGMPEEPWLPSENQHPLAKPPSTATPTVQKQILRTKSDGALLQQGVKKSVEGEKQFSDRRKAHDRSFEGPKAPVERKVAEKNGEKSDRRKGPERRTVEKKAAAGANGSLVDNSSNVSKKAGVITILQRPQTKEAAAENIALFTGRRIEDITRQFVKSAQVVSQPQTKKSTLDVTSAVEAAKDSDLSAKEGGEAEHAHSTRGPRNVSPKRERVSRKKGSRDTSGKVAARPTESVQMKARREVDGLGEVLRPGRPTQASSMELVKSRDAEDNAQDRSAKERESRIGDGIAQDRSAKERESRIGEGNAQDGSAKERESQIGEFECFPTTESQIAEVESILATLGLSLSDETEDIVRGRHLKSDGPVSLAHAKKNKQFTIAGEAVKDAELHSKDGGEGEHVHSTRVSRNVSPKTEREIKGSHFSPGKVPPSMSDVLRRLKTHDPPWEFQTLSKEGLAGRRADVETTFLTLFAEKILPKPEAYNANESSLDLVSSDPIGFEVHHERAATAPGGLQRGSSDSIVREMGQALSDAGRGGSGSFRDAFCDGIGVFLPPKKCERSERWAGPAYTQSPPPNTLPLPSFPQRVRLADVVWRGPQDTNSEALFSSAPSSPTHMANLFLSAAALQQSPFVDPSSATKDLRRILNLDVEDGFDGATDWTEGGVESATQSLKRMLQLG